MKNFLVILQIVPALIQIIKTVEEMFPLRCGIEEMEQFIIGSREIADGWISFYWGETIEENEQKGDLKGAIVAQWLRKFRELSPVTRHEGE